MTPLGAGGRDVQPVEAVKEFHTARRVRMARRCHRINCDRSLLALELIDRAHTGIRQLLLNFKHLRVVRRNDHDVIKCDCFFLAVAIDPGRATIHNSIYKRSDGARFFGRTILVTAVCDRQVTQARPA